ncbi:Lrp/AsnC family transcriptional regulator [Nocardia stercoris]|uniref:Lrp/AsnC family transcriptional regulator n=1 Tax=Nocardia stercoris TaxID=2483361 RepID=A0A3M2KXJ1_9NOCA|nr:Lrp/AsnC family transcriptional regulator [Nocardia stercoris]RMI28943.1 Lrp/AsnC family transcriptional regulator [Nocardia stercoris]
MAQGRGDSVDEVDVMLLDALHANPRASFERLGPALGISAVTAARRWQRLSDSGRAWVSSVPGPQLALVGAVYQVRAQPGRVTEVAHALSAVPQVVSVYATDGAFDLHTLVFAGDMPALTTLLLDALPRIPGIASARSLVGSVWYSAVQWQLGAMDADQKRSVSGRAGRKQIRSERNRVFDQADRMLFVALQRDGRARYRDLARTVGTSETLVRRRVETLVDRGMLSFRTDFARSEGGWPVEYVLWLSVPLDRLDDLGAEIGSWPQTRICLSTTGTANLMVMGQVHRIRDVAGILERLPPEVVVADQRLVLRAFKSWGRLLNADGHALDHVPVDPWAPAGPDQAGLSWAPSSCWGPRGP